MCKSEYVEMKMWIERKTMWKEKVEKWKCEKCV